MPPLLGPQRDRRVRDHPAFAPAEQVRYVGFSCGRTLAAVLTGPPGVASSLGRPRRSADGRRGPPVPAPPGSFAELAGRRSGLVVVTDRRLLFFAERTAFGRPGPVSAWVMRSDVVDVEAEEDGAAVALADGTVAVLSFAAGNEGRRIAEALARD